MAPDFSEIVDLVIGLVFVCLFLSPLICCVIFG